MTSSTTGPDTRPTDYRVSFTSHGSTEEIERQLALAWVSLVAGRDVFPRIRRVTVLRPVIF
ncbi:MAG TPA: hypothetical protein VFP37_10925 [Steroidobacteraceae bacterium]|nr:hypothetical protein [Steroidobacteraceae bacterium]